MRRLIKYVAWLAVINAVLVAGAQLAKRMLPSYGGEESNELASVAIMDGVEVASRANAFREGSIVTAMGGLRLDLTGATLSEYGGTLNVTTVMGGTEIVVPEGWSVEMVGNAFAGENAVDPSVATRGGPLLVVHARSILGATEVTTTGEAA